MSKIYFAYVKGIRYPLYLNESEFNKLSKSGQIASSEEYEDKPFSTKDNVIK